METCSAAHHWMVDACPSRGKYHAVCSICGEEKDFPEQELRLRFTMDKKPIPPPIADSPPLVG